MFDELPHYHLLQDSSVLIEHELEIDDDAFVVPVLLAVLIFPPIFWQFFPLICPQILALFFQLAL